VEEILSNEAFRVAELIAQFVLSEADGWEHIEQVRDAIEKVAYKIRTAEWVPSNIEISE
jgi:hypothetical protein